MNHLSRRLRLIKCVSILILATFVVATFAHGTQNPKREAQASSDRFDKIVREDFFAGMGGDYKRLDHGMKLCEEALAKNPKHAEALVWHGGGLLTRATIAYKAGDTAQGDKLWQQGLDEMNMAVEYEPDKTSDWNKELKYTNGAAFARRTWTRGADDDAGAFPNARNCRRTPHSAE